MKTLLSILTFTAITAAARAASVTVSWDVPATLVEDQTTNYVVQHAGISGVYTNFATVSTNNTSYTLNGLPLGSHSVRLLSLNPGGAGLPGSSVSTNLVWKAGAPVNAKITATTYTNMTVTFTLQ